MYEQINLPDMIKEITSCQEDINLTYELKESLNRTIKSMTPHKKLSITKAVYHHAYAYASEYNKNNRDCNKLIAVLQLMDYSRDLHIAIMEQYDLLIDFTDINIATIHGYDIKKNIITDALSALNIPNTHNIDINYSQEHIQPTD